MKSNELRTYLCDHILTKGKDFLVTENNELVFRDVIVGVQKAEHLVFEKLQEIIPDHLHPSDFQKYFDPGKQLSVISIALLFNKKAVLDNSKQNIFPSRSWYEANVKNAEGTKYFGRLVKKYFVKENWKAIYPEIEYKVNNIDGIRISNWSRRHIAYACGLGSFGWHGALITDKGCCHKLLTFISDCSFDDYAEPQVSPFQNCLFFMNGTCGRCIEKCPVKSLSINGHDIKLCTQHELFECKEKALEIIGQEMPACGLCMSGVPCSFTNPVKNNLTTN